MRRKSPLPNPRGNTQLERATPLGPLDFLLRPAPPAPTDDGRPSIPVNDPVSTFDALAFLSGRPSGDPVLSTVDPDTAISPGGDGERAIRPQTPHNDLMRLRFKFPHLPIVPFPNSTKTIALVGGGPAQDVTLPDSAVLGIFRGNGDYYVSANGAASIPTNTANDDSAQANASVFKPEGLLFYLANLNQISLIAGPADTVVTILFYNGE